VARKSSEVGIHLVEWYTGSSDEHLETMDRIVNQALTIKPDDAFATYCQRYEFKRLRKNPRKLKAALPSASRAARTAHWASIAGRKSYLSRSNGFTPKAVANLLTVSRLAL
jgi:hypothetical protein